METRDRQRGCLLGLAIGDALGAAVEFQTPGSFEPVTEFRAGGPHDLGPGEWTDDTSMALALADSIADVGWDLDDQAQRYVDWWRGGKYSSNGRVFDIDFREAVLAAVNLGDDADTTGAVCGQLAGAYWSERGIPEDWKKGLADLELIERILGALIE